MSECNPPISEDQAQRFENFLRDLLNDTKLTASNNYDTTSNKTDITILQAVHTVWAEWCKTMYPRTK